MSQRKRKTPRRYFPPSSALHTIERLRRECETWKQAGRGFDEQVRRWQFEAGKLGDALADYIRISETPHATWGVDEVRRLAEIRELAAIFQPAYVAEGGSAAAGPAGADDGTGSGIGANTGKLET